MSVTDMQLTMKTGCDEKTNVMTGVYVLKKQSTSLGRSQMYRGWRILAILAAGYSIQL